jgi:crotonobetainyl-CoA:carnitine CoA-transferase CaiB-like acyl-CoA transferase
VQPLDGIRVLDLSRVLAGPICAQNLGDLGADVIKLERPGTGDDTRSWGPPFQGGEAAYFMCANRNKRSLTLDLKSDRGRVLLGRLIQQSDVVIENFKLGTLDSWGFDADWFAKDAPRTIRCSITGYGSKGPKAHLPGYDFLAQAESGLMSICGPPDGDPVKYGVSIVDFCTGQIATIAILSALQARHTTGRGQLVEANLHSTGLSMLINVGASHLMTGNPARRLGNGHPNAVPYREFTCSDGRLALPVGNDAQFARLADAMGHPEWADDPRLATMPQRVENREVVEATLAPLFATRTVQDWLDALQAVGVPVSPIATVADALADPHTKASGMVTTMDHPTAGPVRTINIPYALSETPAAITTPPPTLGQHNTEVLRDVLGLDVDEVDSLRRDGIV